MITGAWLDIKTRRIPNLLSLVTAAAGLCFAVYSGGLDALLWHGASFIAALFIGMLLFGMKMWGGGDGKFLAASAAWLPLGEMFSLMFAISLAGIGLILFRFAGRGFKFSAARDAQSDLVPYGVAIATGTLIVAAITYLQPGTGPSIFS
nr:prepilin peptidase [Erythrobacter ani]